MPILVCSKSVYRYQKQSVSAREWPGSILLMPNQTVKNYLKAKDQIVSNAFCSRKTTNKIFMYLLAPFILQNFKKILRANPELWDVPFLGTKWPIFPEQNFFGTNHYHYFHLPIGSFN